MSPFLQAEFSVLDAIQSLRCPFLDAVMPFISSLCNAGICWIILALALLIPKKHRQCGVAMAIGLLLCLFCNNLLLKPLIARPRPFMLDSGISLLIAPPTDYSFLSGHTLSSFVSASVLWHYEKRAFAIPAFVLAFLIAFSRLYLQVHFLTDVLAGILLGFCFALLAIRLTSAISHTKGKISSWL